MFQPGSIRKIEVKNFVTYKSAEFYPGPNLNMIIGSNGSGKSTMVAAMILALGGNPKTVGRGSKIGEYVKHGCSQAKVDVYLQSHTEDQYIKVTRQFDTQDRTVWMIDNTKKKLCDILELVGQYQIQVNNLCQFLPQDRVQEFARMNKQELLKATQSAVCREDLIEKQEKLIETQSKHENLTELYAKQQKKIVDIQNMNSKLDGKIQSYNKKKKYDEQIKGLNRKIAWLQFEQLKAELQVVKKDKQTIKLKLDEHMSVIEPLKTKLKSGKNEIAKLENIHSRTLTHVRESTKQLRDSLDDQAKIKQSIQKVNQQMAISLDRINNHDKEIDRLTKRAEGLEKEKQQIIDQLGNDEEVTAKVRRLKTNLSQLFADRGAVDDKREDIRTKKQYLDRELYQKQNELNCLENIKEQRLKKLQHLDKDAYNGVLWLRKNKHLFQHEICEPMILEINVLEGKNAIYLENVIPSRDKFAFTCSDKEDMNKLIENLRINQKLSVNILHSSENAPKFKPDVPIEQLKKYGFYAYLSSLFTAPKIIMNYLYRTYRVHTIAIGDQRVGQNYEQLPKEIRNFFSDTCRYTINFSRYTGSKITKQNQLFRGNTFSISLDVVQLENLRSELAEKERAICLINEEMNAGNEQMQVIDAKIAEIETDLNQIANCRKQVVSFSSRIASLRQQIATIENEGEDREQVHRQADIKIQNIIKDLIAHQVKIQEAFKECNSINAKSELESLDIQIRKKNLSILENECKEKQERASETEELHKKIQEEYTVMYGRVKAHLDKAKNLSNGLTPTDPEFKMFEGYDDLPKDVAVLNEEKNRVLTKIDCLKVANDDELNEYETRLNQIKTMETNQDQLDEELNQLKAQVERLETEWLTPIRELIGEIRTRFSNAYHRMNCAGDVSLWTGDNPRDFSKYGLSIAVSYRNGEPLQQLDATTQSGGERAVATAAFMLSLQELTPVPFRCVDEINQGMDANNERRIFDLLIDCTTQPNTSQYFLVTPKLVPGLRFSKNMMIHSVQNAPFIDPDKKWFVSKFCNLQDARISK